MTWSAFEVAESPQSIGFTIFAQLVTDMDEQMLLLRVFQCGQEMKFICYTTP